MDHNAEFPNLIQDLGHPLLATSTASSLSLLACSEAIKRS